jgi:PKHD-type hydroxylase
VLFPVKPKHSPGKDVYAYWENFLSDEDINYILEQSNNETQPAAIGGNNNEMVINKTIRSTELSWIQLTNENMHLWEKISEAVSRVNAEFFKFDLSGFYEPMQLGVYKAESNGHYDWHIDASNTDINTPRKLSMALLLSDPLEFEGGELQIKINSDKPISLELKKGRAWFFPSYILHRVTPVTKGVRKSLVLWVGGPEFK